MSETENSVFIRHLAAKNFLSFGPENPGIDLKALNLFIGPNGSGKSNLIEAISLMRSAPKEFGEVTRKGGGVAEWIWKGKPQDAASIECVFSNPSSPKPLRHAISFNPVAQAFVLTDERVEETEHRLIHEKEEVRFHYRYNEGRPQVTNENNVMRWLSNDLKRDRSIVAQLRDSQSYPELAWLAQSYEVCAFFGNGVWADSRCFVTHKGRICEMVFWKRISPIWGFI